MAKKRIFVDKNGDLITLHDDKFGTIADKYGSKNIHRASMIEYNNTTKLWDIHIPTSELERETVHWSLWPRRGSANTRELALAIEKYMVEDDIIQQLENSCPIHSSLSQIST